MIGSGGARRRLTTVLTSSGVPAAQSRQPRSTWPACSAGYRTGPASTRGPTWWRRNWKAVTTPKFPPPPRTPQNSSGWACPSTRSSRLDPEQSPVGGDHLHRQQVVAGQTVLAHEPADPAAEGEAGDTGVGHDPTGGGQPEPLRRLVQLAPQQTRLRPGAAAGRDDPDVLHRRQVDDHPAVAARRAGHVVPAAADGQGQVPGAGALDPGPHVGGTGAPCDQGRALVDGGVPEASRLVVAGVLGAEQLAPEPSDFGETHHAQRTPLWTGSPASLPRGAGGVQYRE